VAQDSALPEFWDTRYRGGVTPWDAGGAPPALADWIARQPERGRVLVPGCGSGYEVVALHKAGYGVSAIDFSRAAVEAAQAVLGGPGSPHSPLSGLVREADFFRLEDPPFDALYERAFLCALPRRTWEAWAAQCARMVRPGGLMFGFFFFDDNAKGPPFGLAEGALAGLLQASFDCEEDRAIPPGQSLPVFAGRERWQVWRRRR
jgi:SAM-dependent methyltransferase